MRILKKIVIILVVLVFCINNCNVVNAANNELIQIQTKEEFFQFIQKVNAGDSYLGKTVKLENDIDLEGNKENLTPIIGNQNVYFKGVFDGNNHEISGVYIDPNLKNASAISYFGFGLFAKIGNNAIIKNLGINGYVNGKNIVGGIVGIIGDNAKVINCYNNSKVIGISEVGGICGEIHNNGSVLNCYNTGIITATNGSVGGIVGSIYNDKDSFIPKVNLCYNVGKITSINEVIVPVGSIIGRIQSNSSLENLFYNSETSTIDKAIGYSVKDGDNSSDKLFNATKLCDKSMRNIEFVNTLNEIIAKLDKVENVNYNKYYLSSNYPKFNLKKYKVSYYVDNKIISEESVQENSQITINKSSINKEGYTFIGWNDGVKNYKPGDKILVKDENIALIAQYEKVNCSISYIGGEGCSGVAPNNESVLYGNEYKISSNTFTKEGYRFIGWSDGQNIFQPGDIYIAKSDKVQFIAVWEVDKSNKYIYVVEYYCGENDKYELMDTITIDSLLEVEEIIDKRDYPGYANKDRFSIISSSGNTKIKIYYDKIYKEENKTEINKEQSVEKNSSISNSCDSNNIKYLILFLISIAILSIKNKSYIN